MIVACQVMRWGCSAGERSCQAPRSSPRAPGQVPPFSSSTCSVDSPHSSAHFLFCLVETPPLSGFCEPTRKQFPVPCFSRSKGAATVSSPTLPSLSPLPPHPTSTSFRFWGEFGFGPLGSAQGLLLALFRELYGMLGKRPGPPC